MKKLITGGKTAAWGARLSKADFVPNFPVTPQSEIIEDLSEWSSKGDIDLDFCPMESEHSVMSAAVAASATGVRVFTATSSQGLLLMHEVLYIASGMRLPIVMANISRGLSAPITLWSDHNDFLDQRDSGWIMLHAENNQEVLDTIIQAYRIAEDSRVLLPVMVNMDGFLLSHTEEVVDIPKQRDVDRFLPKYNPKHAYFNPLRPMIQGGAVLDSKEYTFFKEQQHKASLNALDVTKKVCRSYKSYFKRKYGLIEKYKLDDAKLVLITQGSSSTVAKGAIDDMRTKGVEVGLLRLRLVRPFPKKEVLKALEGKVGIAVVDQNLSFGSGGIMYPEIKSVLYGSGSKAIISNFITGLGGKFVKKRTFYDITQKLTKDVKRKKSRVEFI
jgi:pyruvate ferredoxin oxidoreductase alpha subunit